MSAKQNILTIARPSLPRGTSEASMDTPIPAGPEWQAALDRVILYLKVLKVPPLEAVEIAHKALKQAAAGFDRNHPQPVAAAMHQVRQLVFGQIFPMGELRPVREREASSAASEHQRVLPFACLPESSRCVPLLGEQPRADQSMPLVSRAKMVPGDFERSPWRFLWTLVFASPRVPSS